MTKLVSENYNNVIFFFQIFISQTIRWIKIQILYTYISLRFSNNISIKLFNYYNYHYLISTSLNIASCA